jgi:hypothetical protein
MTTATATAKNEFYHKWEKLNLAAPYRFITLVEMPSKTVCEKNPMAYNAAMVEAQQVARANGVNGLGSCNVCGTALMNNYICKDAAGRGFVIGCECVKKLQQTELCTAIEKAEKIRQSNKRKAAAEKRREEKRAARAQALNNQREKNGGLTDYELGEKQREEIAAANAAETTAANAWLINVLEAVDGNFAAAMARSLETHGVGYHSPRAVAIMRDIFAKSHGRRNSKAYDAAINLFDEKTE